MEVMRSRKERGSKRHTGREILVLRCGGGRGGGRTGGREGGDGHQQAWVPAWGPHGDARRCWGRPRPRGYARVWRGPAGSRPRPTQSDPASQWPAMPRPSTLAPGQHVRRRTAQALNNLCPHCSRSPTRPLPNGPPPHRAYPCPAAAPTPFAPPRPTHITTEGQETPPMTDPSIGLHNNGPSPSRARHRSLTG